MVIVWYVIEWGMRQLVHAHWRRVSDSSGDRSCDVITRSQVSVSPLMSNVLYCRDIACNIRVASCRLHLWTAAVLLVSN